MRNCQTVGINRLGDKIFSSKTEKYDLNSGRLLRVYEMLAAVPGIADRYLDEPFTDA